MSGLFGGGKQTVSQEAMLTPEQKAAMANLLQLGQTGSTGNLSLGDAYTGSLGDFNQTDTQNLASNKLMSLLQAGSPEGFNTARSSLTGLADNKFDLNDPTNGYAAFKSANERNFNESNDVLNREAAITGDRFSTAIGRNKVDLASRNNDLISSKIADLYNAGKDRALQASQALGNLETQNNATGLNTLAAGFDARQGGLQNTMNNLKAETSYNEFKRQRDEKLKQIDALNTVYNKNVPYGVMSSTATSPSPFSGLLNSALGAAGTAFGGPVGGMLASSVGGLFGGNKSTNLSNPNNSANFSAIFNTIKGL